MICKIIRFFWIVLILWFILLPSQAFCLLFFKLVQGQSVYGKIKTVTVGANDTLLDIARRYDLGYNQIILANPKVDPWLPKPGTKIIIPTKFILPKDHLASGIVVNLSEMRLYYFFKRHGYFMFATGPVGIAKEGFLTKLGLYTVRCKNKNPTWYVPPSVREEDPNLPKEVPPGPDNPLGNYILRLSRLFYGIHGTNKPWGVGRRVSHGCIRMYPEDIKALFPLVPVGTIVQIVYQPIKVGWAQNRCWIQVFPDFNHKIKQPFFYALKLISDQQDIHGQLDIDLTALKKAIKSQNGIPVIVAKPQSY